MTNSHGNKQQKTRKKNLKLKVFWLNKGDQCTRKQSLLYNLFLAIDVGLRALLSDSITMTSFTFSLSTVSMTFLNSQLHPHFPLLFMNSTNKIFLYLIHSSVLSVSNLTFLHQEVFSNTIIIKSAFT